MKTGSKTYSKYTESSLEWTVGIPSDWEKRRFKFIFNLVKRPIKSNDDIITAFRDGTVTLRKNRKEDGFTVALKEIGYQGVRKGDLVISGMDGFAGAIGISDSDGKATPVYSVCQPIQKSIFSGYYKYLLRVLALSGYISILARGVRERSTEFKWSTIGNLLLVVPDFDTQKNIANYLDEKINTIEMLITKKEKMVTLLLEKRIVLISDSITKGLDPNVKVKTSNIEWLDNMPDGWGVRKLKYISKIDTGGIFGDEMVGDVEAKLVTTGQLSMSGEWFLDKMDSRFFKKDEYKKYKNIYGDIVVVKSSGSSSNIVSGKAGFVSEQEVGTVFGNFLLRVRANDVIDSKFLYYFLTSHLTRQRIELMCSSTTYPNLKVGEYISSLVLLPPKEEQKEIVHFLDIETNRINDTIKLIETQIDQLKEYRTSLVYSAVTGKIKV